MTDDEQEQMNAANLLNAELEQSNVVLMAKIETARAEAMGECAKIVRQACKCKTCGGFFLSEGILPHHDCDYYQWDDATREEIVEFIEAKMRDGVK